MTRKLGRQLAAVCAVAGVAGCADSASAPTAALDPVLQAPPPASLALGNTIGVPVRPLFDVTVEPLGVFRPGTPTRVAVTVRAHADAPGAVLRVNAPEAEAARRSAWGAGYRVPVGVALPVHAEWRIPLRAGEVARRVTQVAFPVEGYYSVRASAFDSTRHGRFPNGALMQPEVNEAAWILVDARGGKGGARFDASVLPANVRAEPGPFRRGSGSPGIRGSASPSGASLNSAAGASDSYQFLYAETVNGIVRYVPVADARVRTTYLTAGVFAESVEQQTDANGRYQVACRTGATYSAKIYYENAFINVNGPLPTEHYKEGGNGTPASCGTGGMKQVIESTLPQAAITFQNLTITARATPTVFGRARPRITARLYFGDRWYYSAGDDQIYMQMGSVGGTIGVFLTAHEYGHAFHQKALGGIEGLGSCPEVHYLNGAHNLGCAYSEGFADFFAIAVRGSAASQAQRIARNSGFVPATEGSGDPYDGSIIEGAVAAFLYDVVDAPGNLLELSSESFDQVQLPGSYVAEMITTCRINRQEVLWPRADGIDVLVYCMEGVVDTSLYFQGYFRTRRITNPYGGVRSATSTVASPAAIRTLWKANLYPVQNPGTGGGGGEEPCEPQPGQITCG